MSDTTKKPLTASGVRSYIRQEVLTWPNLITSGRFACVIGMFANPNEPMTVLVLAIIAWVSDGVDGYVAKRFGWCTQLGARLDQYADWSFGVALLYTIFNAEHFTLTWYNTPLLWLISLYLLLRMKYWTADTTNVAKLKTFVQFAGGLVILGGHAWELDGLRIVGYAIITCSLPLMFKSLQSYEAQYK